MPLLGGKVVQISVFGTDFPLPLVKLYFILFSHDVCLFARLTTVWAYFEQIEFSIEIQPKLLNIIVDVKNSTETKQKCGATEGECANCG